MSWRRKAAWMLVKEASRAAAMPWAARWPRICLWLPQSAQFVISAIVVAGRDPACGVAANWQAFQRLLPSAISQSNRLASRISGWVHTRLRAASPQADPLPGRYEPSTGGNRFPAPTIATDSGQFTRDCCAPRTAQARGTHSMLSAAWIANACFISPVCAALLFRLRLLAWARQRPPVG